MIRITVYYYYYKYIIYGVANMNNMDNGVIVPILCMSNLVLSLSLVRNIEQRRGKPGFHTYYIRVTDMCVVDQL